MFSGIIEQSGKIVKIMHQQAGSTFWIQSSINDLKLGESLAVDGICLTVANLAGNQFACDISPETLRLTTAAFFQEGTLVNLERALLMSDRLGGHIVSGHVDERAQVHQIEPEGEYIGLTCQVNDPQAVRYLITKGSITVNGVSLTVNQILPGQFKVMLIPHTLESTNLHQLKAGSWVNLEYDYLAKLVAKQIDILGRI